VDSRRSLDEPPDRAGGLSEGKAGPAVTAKLERVALLPEGRGRPSPGPTRRGQPPDSCAPTRWPPSIEPRSGATPSGWMWQRPTEAVVWRAPAPLKSQCPLAGSR
jgi:hypothetical protein